MGTEYRAPRGMTDYTCPRSELMVRMADVAREVLRLHGYEPICTPVLESTGLFERSIGGETDIVKKEMYTFEDQGGESLTLRPEETAPVVRAYIQRGLASRGLPQKLYYLGPMFRRERPQAGRFRQFHQVGAEAIGSDDPAIDAEIIAISEVYFKRFDLGGYDLLVNSIGCRECRPPYVAGLVEYLEDFQDRLCEDCRKRLRANPLRVLDCKKDGCREVVSGAPTVTSHLCDACSEHFERVLSGLETMGIGFSVDPRLVRGLDYYTRTTFEYKFEKLGAQDTVSAGGRYDYLVEELGGPPTPGVGFSLGMERLLAVLQERNLEDEGRLDLFLVRVPGVEREISTRLLAELRERGFSADTDYMDRGLKSQLKHADRRNARLALIMGPDEIERGRLVFRDLDRSHQWEVPLLDAVEEAVEFLRE